MKDYYFPKFSAKCNSLLLYCNKNKKLMQAIVINKEASSNWLFQGVNNCTYQKMVTTQSSFLRP